MRSLPVELQGKEPANQTKTSDDSAVKVESVEKVGDEKKKGDRHTLVLLNSLASSKRKRIRSRCAKKLMRH